MSEDHTHKALIADLHKSGIPAATGHVAALRREIEYAERRQMPGEYDHIAALRAIEARLKADQWQPIEQAPTDGTKVWLYVAAAHGLQAFQCQGAYHPDAGWCVDNLREATHFRLLPAPPVTARARLAQWQPIAHWRHKQRGGEYAVLTSTAEAQCSLGPINEGDHVTIYQGKDGNWWVRKTSEFQDGRFERIDVGTQGKEPR